MKPLLALFLSLFVSAASFASEHKLIFVHGIGGDWDAFGAMPTLLRDSLQRAKPEVKYSFTNFKYDTDELSHATSEDFAAEFADFINGQTKDFKPGDKFSIIAHSQGGLISVIWYFKSTPVSLRSGQEKDQRFSPRPHQFIDSIITVGSPFWGSKLASIVVRDEEASLLGRGLSTSLNILTQGMIDKLNNRQLEEMALGSDTILTFRKNVASISNATINLIKSKLRTLNIAGMGDLSLIYPGYTKHLAELEPFVFGWKHFESDAAVSIPSARFDSIYTKSNGQTYTTHFAPLVIVPGLHASPSPTNIKDISWTPTMCLNRVRAPEECEHSTFRLIYAHMLGQDVSQWRDKDIPYDELGGFVLSLNARVAGDLIQFSDIKEKKIVKDGVETTLSKHSVKTYAKVYPNAHVSLYSSWDIPRTKIVFKSRLELQSSDQFFTKKYPDTIFRVFTGFIKMGELTKKQAELVNSNGARVRLLVKIDGLPTRMVDTVIRPTFTTHVDVDAR